MNVKVRAIYSKELRDMLRDRRTIFASVVIPIMLYPLLTLGMAEVMQMAKAKLDREEFPVAVLPGTLSTVEKIRKVALETPEPVKGLPLPEEKKPDPPKTVTADTTTNSKETPEFEDPFKSTKFVFKELSIDSAQADLKAGKIRAILILPAGFDSEMERSDPGILPSISIEFDQAERISQSAASRLRGMLERYDSAIVANRLKGKTLSPNFLHAFTLESKNTAAAEKVSGSLLGSMLPFIFIMMLVAGALHPAIDLTAGEKERSTLETLVGTPASPLEIISGKFLAVSTLSMANAALNVGSFAGSVSALPFPKGYEFHFPWAALPLTLMLLVPLALFFSAMLLMVASFAANIKEAQVYCMPVFMIPMSIMAIAMTPGIELQGPLLITPVINTALLIKELFLGHGTLQQILFVLISNCFYAAGMVALASRVFAREEVLFSAQGSLRMFLSRRFFKASATPRAGDSLLVAAIFFPLFFYGSIYLQKMLIDDPKKGIDSLSFALMLAIPQYALFLGLPMLIAKYLKANLSTTFQWRMPSGKALAGAILMGLSSWLIVIQIVKWQSYFWQPSDQDKVISEALNKIANGAYGGLLIFALAALTPAICEEHFFRGFFQQGLGRRNKWSTILLTGAVFAFFHLSPFKMAVLFLLGSVISYVAYKTWSIWPGILLHMMHNALSIFGQGLLFPNAKPEDDLQISAPLLIGAVILFAAGLFIVSRSGPPEPEHDHVLKKA